jgi:DNA-directed RNA polymerase I subunit RPA1
VALEQALTAATATATPSTTTAPTTALSSERRGLTGAAAAGLRLMTPAEAREVVRRLWAANEALLRELYAKNAPGGVFFSEPRGGGGAGGKRGAAASSTALRWREAYRSFFVSTVAVPPNRLRPPSRLGDATFEHPHNVALAAVVSSSADVASAAAPRRLGGGGPDDGASEAAGGGAAAPPPPPDLAAGLRAWLALQSALNSLIDSSAPDARSANAGAAGVRQALEKKEVSDQFFFSFFPLEQK